MAVGVQYINPETGWRRYDDSFYAIKYNGDWDNITSLNESQYNLGTNHISNIINDSYDFYFYGTKFRLIDVIDSNKSNYINVYINDELIDNFSQYGNSASYIVSIYEKEGLELKIHHVKIVNNTSNYISLDAIDIDETGYMVYCDNNNSKYYDVTPTMTSENEPSPYVISYSSKWADAYGFGYWAFNGNINLPYQSANGVSSSTLEFKNFDKAFNAIFIACRNETEFPSNLIVYGSNDEINYTKILEMKIDNPQITHFIMLKDLKNIYEYKYLKFEMDSVTLNGYTYCVISEIRFLLDVDTQFYLINDNGTYKNYNKDTDSLVEVNDISILNKNALENECISNLNNLIPFVSSFGNNLNLISNKQTDIIIKSIKEHTQMIVPINNSITTIQENIDFFYCNYSIDNESVVKCAFTIDNGVTWKTYNETGFVDIGIEIPLKKYSDLTDEEIIKWDTAKNEIYNNGINIISLNDIDFNTFDFEKIRFAFVIYSKSTSNISKLGKLLWRFDEKPSFKKMKDTEIDVEVLYNSIKVTPLIDCEEIKINVL